MKGALHLLEGYALLDHIILITGVLSCSPGDPGGWTSRGGDEGDHPRDEPGSVLRGHGGQRGSGRCEVFPCGGGLHHR